MMSITSWRFIFEIKKVSMSGYSGDQLFQIPRACLCPSFNWSHKQCLTIK
jgi:hypothetical protein